MSTEYYIRCRECRQKMHIGTRYAGGFKFFTIGAHQKESQEFVNRHVFCTGNIDLANEHDAAEDGMTEVGEHTKDPNW